jgi:hypothetical protein
MFVVPLKPPHNCSIPSTSFSSPASDSSITSPFIMRALSIVSSIRFHITHVKTHKFPILHAPILSSNSLDLPSATPITFSGTCANLATFNPYER